MRILTPNIISLFSGIAGIELRADLVFEKTNILQFVEIDENAQKVLRKHFPGIPIWGDIRTYQPFKSGDIEFPYILVGGFPCTNTSAAGKREGLSGDESSLWWEFYRVIVESQPDFIIIENPEGIIHRGLQSIVAALRLAGYFTEIEIISAEELGAPHRRRRVFIIAYSHNLPKIIGERWECWFEQVGDDIKRIREIGERSQTQPPVCSLDDGIPNYLAGLHYSGWWGRTCPPADIGLPRKTPGRRDAINLVGRSVCPLQAAVVWMRVKWLIEMCSYR